MAEECNLVSQMVANQIIGYLQQPLWIFRFRYDEYIFADLKNLHDFISERITIAVWAHIAHEKQPECGKTFFSIEITTKNVKHPGRKNVSLHNMILPIKDSKRNNYLREVLINITSYLTYDHEAYEIIIKTGNYYEEFETQNQRRVNRKRLYLEVWDLKLKQIMTNEAARDANVFYQKEIKGLRL